jgi:hypothetical protein
MQNNTTIVFIDGNKEESSLDVNSKSVQRAAEWFVETFSLEIVSIIRFEEQEEEPEEFDFPIQNTPEPRLLIKGFDVDIFTLYKTRVSELDDDIIMANIYKNSQIIGTGAFNSENRFSSITLNEDYSHLREGLRKAYEENFMEIKGL